MTLMHLKRLDPVLVSLALASAIGLGMLGLRLLVSWRLTHFYLIWNLCLAWAPLGFASLAWRWRHRRLALYACASLWLLFFPNAPYIVTDLVHLRARPPVPLWFDILLLQLFISLGLVLGFISLHRMQGLVAERAGRPVSWIFAVAALGLAGLGIYLGRFLRWNSWDLLVAPLALLNDIGAIFLHPRANRPAIVFSTISGALLFLGYALLFALSGSIPKPEARPEPVEGPLPSACRGGSKSTVTTTERKKGG